MALQAAEKTPTFATGRVHRSLRSTRKRLSVFVCSLVLMVALALPPVVGSAQAAPVFGFDYWPHNGDNSILGANWATSHKAEVESDLDHVASLGGGAIRLVIWPGTGDNCDNPSVPDRPWCISENGGGTLTSEFSLETANVLDLIKLAYDRNIKVIVSFANYYITCGPAPQGVNGCPPPGQPPGPYWWQWAYGNDSCTFMQHAATWINGYVSAIEASPEKYKSAVIAYDYENEVSAFYDYGTGGNCALRNNWDYLKYMYDHTTVPSGKRGVSVLCVTCPARPNDAQALRNNINTSKRKLSFVDFHTYPDNSVNTNLETVYDSVKSYFPTATVVLGEFGRDTKDHTETEQSATVTDIMQRSRTKNIPYYLHWTLWDGVHNSPDQTFGFGISPDDPRSVLGSAASLLHGGSTPTQLVSNPDMETVLTDTQTGAKKPADWSVGTETVPAGSLTLSAVGPWAADAATNDWYARATVDSSVNSGWFWLTSRLFTITQSKRLYVNGYIRSNLTNGVQIWVNEYRPVPTDPTRVELVRQTQAPSLPPPSGWAWRNYLHTVGSWSLALDPTTTQVNIGFVAQVGCWNPPCASLLDVDAVSAGQL